MGIIISMAGHQGGAGKTSTAMNLGISLARRNKKVLLLDSDPVGGMAVASSLQGETQGGLVQILRGQPKERLINKSILDLPLSLLANGARQPSDAFFLEQQAQNGQLGEFINGLGHEYDYLLVDTPSSIDAISSMVFAHSQAIILVLPCRSDSVKTLPLLLRMLQRIQEKLHPGLYILGILVTMFDCQNPYELDVLSTIRLSFPQGAFFSTIIPRSGQFEKAAGHGIPLGLFAENNGIGALYDQLAAEILIRLSTSISKGNHDEQPERLF